jgi:hypothetical protein
MPGNGRGRLSREQAASIADGPVKDLAVNSKPAGASAAVVWRTEALRVLDTLAHCGMPFHVDDFLMLAGDPPSAKQIGAAFAAAKQQRLIEPVGATLANDGRLVRVWVRCHQ